MASGQGLGEGVHGVAWNWGGEMAKEGIVLVWWKDSKIDCGDGCTTWGNILKTTELYI